MKPKTSALSRLNFGVPVATVSRTRKRRNRTEVGSERRFRTVPPSFARSADPSLPHPLISFPLETRQYATMDKGGRDGARFQASFT